MEEETPTLNHLTPRLGSALPQCPVLKVIRAHEFGLVVESNRSFDVGEAITIGFHVPRGNASSTFISAESLVVESRRSWSDRRGDYRYRVTLLFSEINEEDRASLMSLSQSSSNASPLPDTVGLN